jgi:hypothetical protein
MATTKLRFLVPFLFVAACGGGGGGGNTGPVDQETAADYCQQGCDHEHACDATTDVTQCVSDCVADVTDAIREDVFVAATECQTGLECNAPDTELDQCLIDNCDPTGTHEDYEAHCRARLAECDLTADDVNGICETTIAVGGADSDLVGFYCILTPAVMDELDACFDQTDCNMVYTCFQGVLADHGFGDG